MSASNSTLIVNNGSVPADGNSIASITLTLKDSNGNPVSGKNVNLNAACCSSSVQDPNGWHGFPGAATTDGSGNSIFSVRDGVQETITYTAVDTTDNITINQTVSVTFTSVGATATPVGTPGATATPSAATPHDNRYFSQTGFRLDADPVNNYFNARGGINTFGYPTSRTFNFQGFQTQFFQRQVVQLDANGNPRLLNLLDPGLFPYTNVNGSTFPAPDPGVASGAPVPSSPTYLPDMINYIKTNAPDVLPNGQKVNFASTFLGTVSANQAFGSAGGDNSLLPFFDLEVWGAVTSHPAVDPHNGNFIYVRFQRGIMMYDATSGLTQPVLLADYFKDILMGQNVPPDLLAQAQSSPLYGTFSASQPAGVAFAPQ